MSGILPRRALVSVSDKDGLGSFVAGLVELGFEIVSTGGTGRFLQQQRIAVVDVSAYTGFPEIMGGRVKTLHPKIHGAILGRPDLPDDAAAIDEHGIVPFGLVVCNLYPFAETIAKPDTSISEAIEQIDIGGPSMIRSAAKNHAYVAVVTEPTQYDDVLGALRDDRLDDSLRRRLAAAAFEMTARYDRAIADYMQQVTSPGDTDRDDGFPEQLTLQFQKKTDLRYGENPHQRAAFYGETFAAESTLAAARQLNGKELSYNNLLDLDAALAIAREFDAPAAVVIKHNNPCGCGIADSLPAAFEKAYSGDPVSAFGSVLGFNRPLDLATAEMLCEPNRFIEAIIAPGYVPEAFEALTTRPKWKKNVRLLECAAWASGRREPTVAINNGPTSTGSHWDLRRVTGGLLVQDRDDQSDPTSQWQCVTERQPSAQERVDLQFAWLVCKHVKSNAIVFAKEGTVVGIGAGQMSRLDSAFIAAHKAGERSRGGVVASDAFFPFRDGVDEVASAGITAVVQPGGSRRDEEVIAACNEHGMAMLFTSRRHFRH
jgi:phosphoribosylaminoimidazolecarboxamide formyltransferase/IMP cyclohydrolase